MLNLMRTCVNWSHGYIVALFAPFCNGGKRKAPNTTFVILRAFRSGVGRKLLSVSS